MPTSSLLSLAGKQVVIDCGLGVARGLADQGFALKDLSAIVITHLHSDHTTDLNDVLTTRWAMSPVPAPLDVVGPPGTAQLVERTLRHPLPAATLLNVNVPDIPLADVQGIEVTRLGKRHKAEGVIRASNPRGQTVYWIGAAGEAQDAGPGTDFHAVAAGRVSITPLQIDLTHAPQMGVMRDWLAA